MADGILDETLNELADNLAVDENLPKLGLKLGFRQNKVDLYMRTNKKNDTSEGTSKMLFAWKKNTPKSQQIQKLVKALIDSELMAFAEETFPDEARRQQADGQEDTPVASSASNVDSSNPMDRIVSDKELLMLAKNLPANSSTPLAIQLGVSYIANDNIRRENPSSRVDGNLEMLMQWKRKTDGGKMVDLDKALDEAECGGIKYKDA